MCWIFRSSCEAGSAPCASKLDLTPEPRSGAVLLPQAPCADHPAVVATATLAIDVVPVVSAPSGFAVLAFGGDAQIDQEPRQVAA
jgi:hypothetical protein